MESKSLIFRQTINKLHLSIALPLPLILLPLTDGVKLPNLKRLAAMTSLLNIESKSLIFRCAAPGFLSDVYKTGTRAKKLQA